MHGPENRPQRGAGRYAILLLLVALALIVGCKKDEDSDSTTPPPASPPRGGCAGRGSQSPWSRTGWRTHAGESRPPRPRRGSGGRSRAGPRCESRSSRPRRGSGRGAGTGPGSERRRPSRPWRGSGGGTSAGPGCARRGPSRSGSDASRRSGASPAVPPGGAKPIPVKAVKPPVHEDYGLPYTELEKRTKLQQFADVYGVPVTWVKEKDWNGKIIEWAVFHDDKWGNVKIPVALVMDGPYLTLLKPYFRFYPLTEFRKGIRKIRIGGCLPAWTSDTPGQKDKMEAAEKAAAEAAAAPATPAPGAPGRGGGGPGSAGWTGPRRSWGGV